MSRNGIVTMTENNLRSIEGQLESIGRAICSHEGSGECWSAINRAITDVQEAIHTAFLIRTKEMDVSPLTHISSL